MKLQEGSTTRSGHHGRYLGTSQLMPTSVMERPSGRVGRAPGPAGSLIYDEPVVFDRHDVQNVLAFGFTLSMKDEIAGFLQLPGPL